MDAQADLSLRWTHMSEDTFSYIAAKMESGPEVIKLFFMLNSAEHEIFSANKYENANNSWHFHIY